MLRYVLPDAGDLDGEVGHGADGPEGDQGPADPPVHDPPARRHDHQQRQQRRQEHDRRHHQRAAHLDVVRLVPERSVRVLGPPAVRVLDRLPRAAQPDPQ